MGVSWLTMPDAPPPPAIVRLGSGPGAPVAELWDAAYALHGAGLNPEREPLAVLEGGAVRVYTGSPPEEDAASAGPVYRDGPGGTLLVPTGRCFVRFRDDARVADRAGEVEAAGYAVDEILAYAPHAAWLAPASGVIADGLAGIVAVEEIPGVVSAEPQMLRAAAFRPGDGA